MFTVNLKNLLFFLITMLLVFSIFGTPVNSVSGQEFTFLEPLPGFDKKVSDRENLFINYTQRVFTLALGLSAILAVGAIVFAGVEYTFTAVSESAKKDAKDRISGAIGGLLLILSAYIILYAINPDLVRLGIGF